MGKKYLDTKENSIESAVMQVWQEAAKKLDPVGKADADIDNDGDVDSSDKYLKKRRAAIGKAMKEAKQKPYVSSDRDGKHVMSGSGKIVKTFKDIDSANAYLKKNFDDLMKESPEQMDEIVGAIGKAAGKVVGGAAKLAGKAAGSVAKGVGSAVGGTVKGAAKGVGSAVGGTVKGTKKVVGGAVKGTASATKKVVGSITSQYEGLEDSPNAANSQHLCAKNVVHEEWGEGQPVHGMHAMPDADGNIAWYDVMFEHGIEKGVSINELKVRAAESHHDHGGKKKKNEGAMKRGKDMDTFKPKPKNEEVDLEQQQEFKVQSMRDAMEQVWATSAEDKLFETVDLMTEEQYDEYLESLNEEELNELIRAIGRGIKKVATMGTAASRADRAEKKLGKAQARQKKIDTKVANKARIAKAKDATAALKKKNPTVGMKAKAAVGSAAKSAGSAIGGAAKSAGSAIMGKKKETPA